MKKDRILKNKGRVARARTQEGLLTGKSDYIEVFRDFLKSKGLRFTKERRVILEEVFKYHGHFDIDEFYLKVRREGLKISKASIYRTLPLFLECGLVDEVKTKERQAFYEHIHGQSHHDHMICLSCGKVIEFYSPEIENLQDELCRKKGFKSLRHVLEIQGHCKDCAGG